MYNRRVILPDQIEKEDSYPEPIYSQTAPNLTSSIRFLSHISIYSNKSDFRDLNITFLSRIGTLLNLNIALSRMEDDQNIDLNTVSVSMEISGPYSEVVSKLKSDKASVASLEPLTTDIEALLTTVQQIDGGTRSAIAENLPADTSIELDAQAVVETMQVLERYDLVVLEGNTWKPGPKLQERQREQ
jgi:hypothetical protein